MPELESELAEAQAGGQDTPARRKLLSALLKRLLPPMYRDPASDETRVAIGRRVLRPLLEIITEAEQTPDRAVIELVGMLGNGDAAPALVRLAIKDKEPSAAVRASMRALGTAGGADTQLAALVALARLGDPRGRPAFARFAASTSDRRLRAAAIWGLGRLPDASEAPELIKALDDRQLEVVAAACLGLGRHPGPTTLPPLLALATDARRPSEARRAAILGLGHAATASAAARASASEPLIELLDSGEPEVAQAAGLALAWSRDPRALLPLLSRALLPRRYALSDAAIPLEALAAWQASAVPPDEARKLMGAQLDVDTLLAASGAASTADLAPLWRGHTRELQDLPWRTRWHAAATRATRRWPRSTRRLDAPALGALTPESDVALSAETAAAVREVVLPLADKLAALLDDAEPETRAAALRVLAKLGDDRVTPTRIATAAFDASPADGGRGCRLPPRA